MIKTYQGRTTFLVGSDKHAGKTTYMNYLLRCSVNELEKFAYLSIGIDGEGNDILTGMPKPKVKAEVGAYIVTTESALIASDALYKIMEVFPIKTKLGFLILVKVLRKGFIELVGPETNSQLSEVISSLKNDYDIKTIFIDGAVDRLSQITASHNSDFEYVSTVTPQNVYRTAEKILFIHELSNLNEYDQEYQKDKFTFYCHGMLNKSIINSMHDKTNTIVINDISSVFLSYVEFMDVKKKYKVLVRNSYNLKNFIVNLKDLSKIEFNSKLGDSVDSIIEKTIFNPYQNIS